MPDRIRADKFLGCGLTTPPVRAFDLDAITGPQVMIAEPRDRSVRRDRVGSLSEASDAHAEAESRHAGHGESEVSRRVRDGAICLSPRPRWMHPLYDDEFLSEG